MSEKRIVSVWDILKDTLLPCIEIYYNRNAKAWENNAKVTFVRKKSTPLERDENGKVTKWDNKTTTFYEWVTIPEGLEPSQLCIRETSMFVQLKK